MAKKKYGLDVVPLSTIPPGFLSVFLSVGLPSQITFDACKFKTNTVCKTEFSVILRFKCVPKAFNKDPIITDQVGLSQMDKIIKLSFHGYVYIYVGFICLFVFTAEECVC